MLSDRQGWSKGIGIVSWTLKIASVSTATLWKVPVDKAPLALQDVLRWIQGNGWWMFVALAVLILIIDSVASKLRDPWILNAVQEALDELQQHGFEGKELKNDPLDLHRLTLFRHHRTCFRRYPFWGGFMVPVLRSGHLTKRTNAFFRVPDRADQTEGIVGRAFRTANTIKVTDLPDVGTDNANADDVMLYAEKTFVTPEWVRENKPKARSFMGIPVRVGGKILWILVVDSQKPDSEAILKKIERRYETTARNFVKLLERLP